MAINGFRNVTQLGESLLSDQLETNLKTYFDWSMLTIGGFFNIVVPTSGVYGGDFSRLRPVSDPNYTDGQVWEGPRKDWVWETGVYSTQPINISGVYVNNTFRPGNGIGPYAHSINYPLGRVVFDSAISTSSTVKAEYSYRYVQTSTADATWWRNLQFDSLRVDNANYLPNSGTWGIIAQNRIQLPHVVLEAIPQVTRYGSQIGGLNQVVKQDVLWHVLTEHVYDRKQLHDIITYQAEARLYTFDKNLAIASGVLPLTWEGDRSPEGLTWPSLISDYRWKTIRLVKATSMGYDAIPPFYYSIIRMTVEVDL